MMENTLKLVAKLYLVLDIRLKGIFLKAYISQQHLRTPIAIEGGAAFGYNLYVLAQVHTVSTLLLSLLKFN